MIFFDREKRIQYSTDPDILNSSVTYFFEGPVIAFTFFFNNIFLKSTAFFTIAKFKEPQNHYCRAEVKTARKIFSRYHVRSEKVFRECNKNCKLGLALSESPEVLLRCI